MHELGIEAIRQSAKKIYTKKQEKKINRVRRNFTVSQPNKVWVSDITMYSFGGNRFFICVIIDLFSRKVVSYRISTRESKQIVSSALKEAIETRNPPTGLVFHSDRGGQYIAKSLQKMFVMHGIVQSFSESGKPYDNAVSEAFFSTLKKEELYRHDYRSVCDFRKSVSQYIQFYNAVRTHSFLGYVSPDKYEEKYCAKNERTGLLF